MSQRRVIVAQPAALCREGAGLLQAGVLRWMLPRRRAIVDGTGLTMAAEPAMTFIVKVTFSYADCKSPSDEMALSEEPEGMALDVPSELPEAAEGETAYASDFVPLKRLRDVLVTGHAYSTQPAERLLAAFELGTVSRAFAVQSAMPSVRAPLIREAIRARRGPGGVGGGPAAPPSGAGPAGGGGESAVEPVGPSLTPKLLEEYPFQFDFLAYNTAPPSQRLEVVPPGGKLILTGLSPRADKRTLKLPGVAPVMWIDTTEERDISLDLDCDTVWIDTDREILVMVYRTLMQVPSLEFDGVKQMTLALAKHGVRPPSIEEVRKDIARGAYEAAVELHDFEDEAGPPPEPSIFARYEIWSRHEEPTISLAMYATVAAALAEGKGPRAETLERHGFDEERFLLEEKGWLTRIADAAMDGNTELASRYGELFVDAQDRLAGPGEGKETLEEYAVLKVDVEDAEDPQKVLADRKMTFAEWMRMDRRWTRRGFEDEAIEEEIERRCAMYRARVLTEGTPGQSAGALPSGPPGPSEGKG